MKMENNEKLITIFEKVQKVPYKVCMFDKDNISKNLEYEDCRHKSHLLFILLKQEGFEVKKVKVLFDWRDLPLPEEMIAILKESDKVWPHDSVEVKIKDNWIKVDCTWNPELGKVGFPITKDWNGISDTEQVTKGNLQFFEFQEFNIKSNIIKEEAYKFTDKLNEFVQNVSS